MAFLIRPKDEIEDTNLWVQEQFENFLQYLSQSGNGAPGGGVEGQILTKRSSIDGDAVWENLIFDGGNA